MPGYLRKVDIVHALAIDVNVEIVRETRDPLGDAALGPVPLINKRRDDEKTRLYFCTQ